MKNLRRLAGFTIFLIFVFMLIALIQYRAKEDMSLLPDQFEYFFNENWSMASLDSTELSGEVSEERWSSIDLPYEGNSGSSDTIIFKNVLSKDHAGFIFYFAATDTDLRVILDGEILYQQEKQDSAKEKSYDIRENYITIPRIIKEGELWIEMHFPSPNIEVAFGNAKIETRDMVVIGVVGSNIIDIGCCVLILLMAIIMFVLAVIRWYTHQPVRGEIFLGLAGLIAGIYCFIGTDTLNIFYNIQEAYEMQEYLVLVFPLFLAFYFEQNLRAEFPRRFSVLLCFVSLNAVVQIALHLSGIHELQKMINLSVITIGLVCATAIVSMIHFDYKYKRYRTLVSVLAMLVLMSGGIVNVMINVLFQGEHVNIAGQYSITIFQIIMAVVHVLQLSKEYRANAEERVRIAEQQNVQLAQAKQEADAARQEALAANEAKGKFLAHMSHEIRTPINAVLGMDEMILRESKEKNIKEYAMDIYMAGQTLLSLINDILDFSKIDSGKMVIIPIEYDVSSLIHDLSNMTSQRAKDKNIRLEVEIDHNIPSRLFGDDVRIRQVLTNILTNAVKYTQQGTVWLRAQCIRLDENEMAVLRFEVEDTGIGIKEEDLPKLSAEFERIEEDRNRNIEGTGLGMSITVQLLSLLGSRLQVESVYGEGSKFYFELEQKVIDSTPIGDFEARIHQITENYHYSTKFYAPDAKLLVVDDNAVNRKVLRNLLKETRIQVTDAESGKECLKLIQENYYDLIFLDHMMPEMDGVETLHHIKKLSDCPCQDTPIVVLTANAVSGAKEKYLAEGFDDFLSKPIVPEKLENMIRNMLPEELIVEEVLPEDADSSQIAASKQTKAEVSEEFLEEFPQVDGLDWHYAWLHLPDKELLEYTIKEFYAQIDSAADKLEQLFGQLEEPNQMDLYRIQVHAMKSLAATVGIIPLAGVAKILEYAARDGKIETILSMTEAFLEEWRSYRQKLWGILGIGTETKKEVTDGSVIQALVEMVRLSMQEMDIDNADQVMSQLREYEYSEEINQNIQKLAEAVTNLDTEETERIADLLMEQIAG